VPVKGGSTLELCLQLSWLANPNPVQLDVEVSFHSFAMRGAAMASDRPLRLGAADTFARLEVGAPLRTERLSPKAELVAVERALRPSRCDITAGSSERRRGCGARRGGRGDAVAPDGAYVRL